METNQFFIIPKEFFKYDWYEFLLEYPNNSEFKNLLLFYETGEYNLGVSNKITKLIEGILYMYGIILPKKEEKGERYLLESKTMLGLIILKRYYIQKNDFEMVYTTTNRINWLNDARKIV